MMRRNGSALSVAMWLVVSAAASAQPASIDEFFNAFTDEWMRANPSFATSTRYFTGAQQDELDRQITSPSIVSMRERIELAQHGLTTLATFERAALAPAERFSADLMQWQLQSVVDRAPYLEYSYPFEQFDGVNVSIVRSLTSSHPVKTKRDVENYLAALAQVPIRIDEAMVDARALAARGIVPPRFILDSTIDQLSRFIDGGAATNTFVTVLEQKMAMIEGLSASDRNRFRDSAETIVTAQVEPAWRRAIALLRSQVPMSTDEPGLSRLPGGGDAYRYFLRLYTTTSKTPDEIHALGVARVAAIEQQMDAILRRLGRTDGTVGQRIDVLKKALAYPEPTSEASRAAIMRDIDVILTDAQVRAVVLFDKWPRAKVVAQPYPSFEEANQAARSMAPAPDGSRPGIFLFPRRVERMTRFGLKTLTYHETVPGHFLQVGLKVENAALPRFRQIGAFGTISAFNEGWALYAERLAAESGWYDDDPEGLLGQLDAERFRARRLVVDTGLHTQQWTRQQAIDYGIEPSEVERYVVNPGQACSYMIGQLEILQLRDRARQALGDRFSLKDFHSVVLDTGTVPLNLLAEQVDAYIAAGLMNRDPAAQLDTVQRVRDTDVAHRPGQVLQ